MDRMSIYSLFMMWAIHNNSPECYGSKMAAKAERVILRINAVAIKEGWQWKMAIWYENTPYGRSRQPLRIRGKV